MLMGVYFYARAYLFMVRTGAYIHGVGFCIAYSRLKGFLRTSMSG